MDTFIVVLIFSAGYMQAKRDYTRGVGFSIKCAFHSSNSQLHSSVHILEDIFQRIYKKNIQISKYAVFFHRLVIFLRSHDGCASAGCYR